MSLITSVVGYSTATTTQILGIFERAGGGAARLAFRDSSGNSGSVDVALDVAAPYGLAKFKLKGLMGPKLSYAIADYDPNEAPPAPDVLLASKAARSFRLPAAGPLRVGLISCNDIDNHAFPKEQRGAMWRRLGKLVEAGEVDLLVHAGDQIYGDGDPVGWSPAEGRTAAYRRHYVNTWSHPDVAAVLASCPNLMMWDDHEIYDGWGSNQGDVSGPALNRFEAAAQAFREFQDPLNPPDRLSPGFGWCGKYGDLAIMAVDGRSFRNWSSGSIMGGPQLDAMELRLNELAQLGLKHLMVVVGTPVVYVPLIAAEKLAALFAPGGLDDIRDGWTSSHNHAECRRFLTALLKFSGVSPSTQVTLVAGDIHVGSLGSIRTTLGFGPNQAHPHIHQVTSSGIARPAPSGAEAFMTSLITGGGTQALFNEEIVGSLVKVNGSDHPFCVPHRNFAVLDPSDGKGGWDVQGNLAVRFHVELGNNTVFEQRLLRNQ
jgi:hypothetical protein